MNIAVVRFPGSNCDDDALHVLNRVMGVNARFAWHKETSLGDSEAVIIPGGFSYGDYLRAGAMAAHSPVMAAVKAFADKGGPVLAICNGFQIACEAGLLPGALLRNETLKFVSEPVRLRVENSETMFTNRYEKGQVLVMPIAHGDGRYTADEDTLDRLDGDGRVVFRYLPSGGEADEYWSPNGSMRGIAGIISDAGNVLGLMPHPERAVDALLGSDDGLGLFESMLARVTA